MTLNLPKIIGHRGIKALVPENTILSINEAIKHNLKWIEVDVKVSKDKDGIVNTEQLTKKWEDWIDYWSVDFDFESKPEIIKFKKDEKIEEVWTGNYIFENEWQSFRTKSNKKLELKSSEREVVSGETKVAVKVVDIFGNDTMKVVPVTVGRGS